MEDKLKEVIEKMKENFVEDECEAESMYNEGVEDSINCLISFFELDVE